MVVDDLDRVETQQGLRGGGCRFAAAPGHILGCYAHISCEQSRGVMLFSSAYWAAAASIIGRTTSCMGSIQSLTTFQAEPSHCWMITGPLPSWSSQVICTGGVKPARPSSASRSSVRSRFSRPQRTSSPVSGRLPNLPMAVRIASVV